MKIILTIAASILISHGLSAQELSPTIKNGILEKRVLAAVKDQNFSKASDLLAQMQALDVIQPPEYFYLDGRVQYETKHYNASRQSLITFITTATSSSASYDTSLEIIGKIQELQETFNAVGAVRTCDIYQASPFDADRPEGVEGVDFRSTSIAQPAQKCDAALAIWADHPRMLLNWARVAPASKQDKAIAALTLAANQGYEAAYFELGRRLSERMANAADLAAAETWLKKALEQNDPRAVAELGALYLKLENTTLAVHWLEQAREAKNFTHNIKLAEIYIRTGDPEHFNRAPAILQEAKDAGDYDAAFALTYLASRPEFSGRFQSSQLYQWSHELPGSIERGFNSHLVLADALLAGEGALLDYELLLDAYERAKVAIDGRSVSWGDIYKESMLRRIERLSASRFEAELCFRLTAFHDVPELSERYPFIYLDQIDKEAARRACQLAHEASPDNLLVTASLGRIEETTGNWEEAERLYSIAADEAFPAGYVLLGELYGRLGRRTGKDTKLYSKAFKAFQAGNNHGLPEARLGLAWAIQYGYHGGEPDPGLAFRMIKEMVDTGLERARATLGLHYWEGTGVSQDRNTALELFEAAAVAGNRHAQLQLGYIHKDDGDYLSAAYWFELAHDQGSGNAAFSLGVMHSFGDGVPRNDHLAHQFFYQAAHANNANGMYFLGRNYETGRGTIQDTDKAVSYYQMAIDHQHKWAKLDLAELYFNNPAYPQNLWRAKYWLDQVTLSHERVETLRDEVSEGLGRRADVEIHYCDRFAAAPIDPAVPGDVDGVSLQDIDLKIVTEVCLKAIEEQPNTARFKFQLGRAFDASQDYNLALQWYTQAAEQGHATAQFTLGWIYLNAEWAITQPLEGVEWLTRAADQNLRQAKFHLGKAYYEGTGVDVDKERAIGLLKAAVAQGDVSARKYLENL
ncbi:SEL1-like repeat protein [Pseudophaeobacter sp. EL27]|uniref:SEL1-like repeat protein n=1 Tax=Pseudophaeobacter sp. EL27 TaxID=2107580 RepID=UPI0013C4C996|nr:SEL1-like repeat protein [Pseudophaeobacter sp. EL27]